MTALSVAEATGLYGFAVSVLAANGKSIQRERVLDVGTFCQNHPELGMIYLRRAEGYTQREIAEEMRLSISTIKRRIHGPLVHMASLLDASAIV